MSRYLNKQEFGDWDERHRANLINSLSGYKSANLIASKSKEGISNLAIFSSMFHIGSSPALQGFVSRPNSVPRHTLENIIQGRWFTVNQVNSSIYQRAHQTSARYKENISEFEACGLTEQYLEGVEIPFVKEAKVKSLFELVETFYVEHNQTWIIVGEVCGILLEGEYLKEDGTLDLNKADTVAVAGLNEYHGAQLLNKLPYAKPKK